MSDANLDICSYGCPQLIQGIKHTTPHSGSHDILCDLEGHLDEVVRAPGPLWGSLLPGHSLVLDANALQKHYGKHKF